MACKLPLLHHVLQRLKKEQICYCLLRDGDRLEELACGGEVDLLVEEHDFGQLCDVLKQLGFLPLPAWGHWPHQFFVAYLEQTNTWLKFDVVTQVAYGRPSHALCTNLANSCLGRRRRLGPAYVPSPEDELVTLLLHCVLDKSHFTPAQRQRLLTVHRGVTDRPYVTELLKQNWSPLMNWCKLSELIDLNNWDKLLEQAGVVQNHLTIGNRFGVCYCQMRDLVLRKLDRWTRVFRYRTPSVAILAPDGAGKSTLVAALQNSFFFSARCIYMGLYPKAHGRPRRSGKHVRLPIKGLGLASLLLKQWSRYLTARYHQARGRLVLFDRYTYDALLPTRQQPGRLRRWRRQLLAHACPAPDLVVLLNAPGEVLYARKGEHCAQRLEEQRQFYLAMSPYLPQMVVVDATRDADWVLREVTRLIWSVYNRPLKTGRSA